MQSVVMGTLAWGVLRSVTVWMVLSVTRKLGNAVKVHVQQDGRECIVKQVCHKK